MPPSPSIHGVPASQPSRSVFWVLLHQRLPFEVVAPTPDAAAELAALNPRRLMPVLLEDDFGLHEMAAILAYLCNEHGWTGLYPTDLRERAVVDQYLHFHHHYTRLATFKLMGPHVTIAMGGMPPTSTDVLMKEVIGAVIAAGDKAAAGRPPVEAMCTLLEQSFFRRAGKDLAFLCSDDGPTIADFACYEELAQLAWAGLFDFAGYKKLAPWLERMAALPGHEAVHAYNHALGDIVREPNTMERFTAANLKGFQALAEAGVAVRGI